MIAHFAEGLVKNIVEIALTRNKATINGSPVKELLPIKLLRATVRTVPILLFLNTFTKIEPSRIKITVRPIPSSEWVKSSEKSLLFFIVFAPIP